MVDSSDALLQEGEKGLFAQVKESGDKQKLYDNIKTFFADYNSGIKNLKDTAGTMNDFYRQMLIEAPEDAKEELAKVGVSFAKDGTASVESKSEVVSKVKFIATRISNNAEASVKSYSSGYSSKGNLYNGSVNSRFDFRG